MGYYMRYLIEDKKIINLDRIQPGLKTVDPNYRFADREDQNEYALLMLGEEILGELEINRRGSGVMDEELEELFDRIEDSVGPEAERVQRLLREVQAMVVVRVLHQARKSEETLERIDPLWEWLFREYRGLLQADSEGY